MTVGLPASGKSTWLKSQGILHPISSDTVRKLLTDDVTNQTANALIFATVRHLLAQRLRLHRPETYIDATSLTRKERAQYIRLARPAGATVEAVFFDTPVELCKERNRLRSRVVPDEAMDYLAGRLERPVLSEGLSSIRVIAPDGSSTVIEEPPPIR